MYVSTEQYCVVSSSFSFCVLPALAFELASGASPEAKAVAFLSAPDEVDDTVDVLVAAESARPSGDTPLDDIVVVIRTDGTFARHCLFFFSASSYFHFLSLALPPRDQAFSSLAHFLICLF